jgi:hypothetical protein
MNRKARRLFASAGLLVLCLACTVIRDRDPPDSGPVVVDPPEVAGTVDLLVLVDLDPNAANLAASYAQVADNLRAALSEARVEVRKTALAPLHHRVGGVVPLLRADDSGMLASVVSQYSIGEGAAFLSDVASHDYANVIDIGSRLATAPLYEVGGIPEQGEAHFEPAADGFVVLIVSGRGARCGGDCRERASAIGAELMLTGESGNAQWLALPGGTGLPPSRIFYVIVTPPEVGADHGALAEACLARPNFPTATLDFLQPSPEFHSIAASAVGNADFVDICHALSSQGRAEMNGAAAAIQAMVR